MKTRILIVEDHQTLLDTLERSYCRIFKNEGHELIIERCTSGEVALELAESARQNPYDFVSLDVNLGQRAVTGMDVLGALKQFRSAWMVALLTGVETDSSGDDALGKDRAQELRKELRREAYENFPAERLLVVEKPPASMPLEQAHELLMNRLKQIVSVYAVVTRLRYVFRPIEVQMQQRKKARRGQPGSFVSSYVTHWQIRFNCGELRTLPDIAGFRMVHHLLSQPRNFITADELLTKEPKQNEPVATAAGDALEAYFKKQGINWRQAKENERRKMVEDLAPIINQYLELRRLAEEDRLDKTETRQFQKLKKQLGKLAEAAERGGDSIDRNEEDELALPPDAVAVPDVAGDDLHAHGGNYDQLGMGRRGKDSPNAALCRSRMRHVRNYLRENGFADFADHLATYTEPEGGRYRYSAPADVDWTTT